jgi:O-antigen/teichoic acid export membrane protein
MESMLAIAVWAGIFVGVALVRGAYCTTKNLNAFLLYSTTAGAIVNVGLNLLLLPKYGGRGAAIATLASYAMAGYLTSFFYGPTIRQGRIISELLLPWNAWRHLNWRSLVDSIYRGRVWQGESQ